MKIKRIEVKAATSEKRVAAYARVSTLTEQQEDSYETQVRYYTDYINSISGWRFFKIFTDHGITGTSAKKRPGFMEMFDSAKRHEFDILLVKSVSRFARNAADAINYIHELRMLGIEVRFEKENLSTFDPNSEMLLNLMAVVAQEESRSISANVRWAYKKRAEQGIRHVGNNKMLGYDEIEGVLTPNDDAWIVKQVFEQFAAGLSVKEIIDHLTEAGARTMRTKKVFTSMHIRNMLENEAYVGDRRLQKTAHRNYITKKPDPTIPYDSYYITDDHPPIVSRELWEKAQERLQREQQQRDKGIYARKGTHFLYGHVVCGECGCMFTRVDTRRIGCTVVKGWECIDRKNGKKGNGCKNAIYRENMLLEKISNELNLEWDGPDAFDVWTFLELVDRVEISGDRIEIIYRT